MTKAKTIMPNGKPSRTEEDCAEPVWHHWDAMPAVAPSYEWDEHIPNSYYGSITFGGGKTTMEPKWSVAGASFVKTFTYKVPAQASSRTITVTTTRADTDSTTTQADLEKYIRGKIREHFNDKMLAAMIPAIIASNVKPSLPAFKRVLVEGYPMARVIEASVIGRWVEVLVCGDDGEPIYDEAEKRWRKERLTDVTVEIIPDRKP